jgi:hypothetical protein
MAIFHSHAKIIGRSAGHSVVAAAAYRSGNTLYDKRGGETHDYGRKGEIALAEIMLPPTAPAAFRDRSTLWNAVESAEKRKDAQLARDFHISLPIELTRTQQIALVREFVQSQFVDRGMCADFAIHTPKGNPHFHLMTALREVRPDGFGQKVREWNDRKLVDGWRAEWARLANTALERAGHAERIDHRSNKARGLEKPERSYLPKLAFENQKTMAQAIARMRSNLAELTKQIDQIEFRLPTLTNLDRGAAVVTDTPTPSPTITPTSTTPPKTRTNGVRASRQPSMTPPPTPAPAIVPPTPPTPTPFMPVPGTTPDTGFKVGDTIEGHTVESMREGFDYSGKVLAVRAKEALLSYNGRLGLAVAVPLDAFSRMPKVGDLRELKIRDGQILDKSKSTPAGRQVER